MKDFCHFRLGLVSVIIIPECVISRFHGFLPVISAEGLWFKVAVTVPVVKCGFISETSWKKNLFYERPSFDIDLFQQILDYS